MRCFLLEILTGTSCHLSDSFKPTFDLLSLTQLIKISTRPKFSLDLFLTNAAHKYSDIGIFANEMSNHCVISIVRQANLPEQRPQFLVK